MIKKTLFVLVIFAMASLSSAFDLSPSQANSGDKITLTGTASPGEQLSFSSSFSMTLPVTGGQYSYETSVVVPQTPNRFSVTARNVQDLNAGVKLVIWITKRFEAQGGTVSLSQANVPQGQYNLKVFGQAQEGASTVPVDVTAETGVKADENGAYSLVIDTSGIPSGEYRIEGAGETKTIPIGGYRAVETRTQDTSQPELAQSNAPQTAVTPSQEPSAPSQPERVAETKPPELDIISKLRSFFGI